MKLEHTILFRIVIFCLLLSISYGSQSNSPQDLTSFIDNRIIQPNELTADLEYLFETIEEVHPNMYAYVNRESYVALKQEFNKVISLPLSRKEFYFELAPIISDLKHGHTYIQPFVQELSQFATNGGRVFPLVLGRKDQQYILQKNHSNHTLPLAGSVLSINGKKPAILYERYSRHFPAENKNSNYTVVQRPEIFGWLLWLEYGNTESWTVEIEDCDGVTKEYVVNSVALTDLLKSPQISTDAKPQNFVDYQDELNVARIVIGSFSDSEQFRRFLATTFKAINEKQITNLIIDIRDNPGGSDRAVAALSRYIASQPFRLFEKARLRISPLTEKRLGEIRQAVPEKFNNASIGSIVEIDLPFRDPHGDSKRFHGKVFVLIGPNSFSASTIFAGAVQHFHMGTLIGEETGDPPTLYADSMEFTLPNSKLQFIVGTKQMISPYSANEHYVSPDHKVIRKSQDIQNGVDTVLQFTFDLISSKDRVKETHLK
ncbi:MAG: S41 family peptidase [Planctomycetota bacterium]|jgi:hypothetical protein